MTASRSNAGVALIVVLWVVMLLSLLIAGFAFTMQVETELTSFNRKQLKAEMIARSGVEVVRMLLIQDVASATEGEFDALNQLWATNDLFYVAHPLDGGVLSVVVVDEESKFPINPASPEQLRRLLDLVGVDPVDADVIADSIVDWIDENDLHQLNGAEDEYYRSLDPPYRSKNAMVERVEELLLVRGVSPEIMYGEIDEEFGEQVPGLIDLVTATSSGRVNVNTASALVMQAYLDLDDLQVESVINQRDGGDGVPGTEDDQPFATVDEFLQIVGGVSEDVQQELGNRVTVQSNHFSVRATAELGPVRRAVWAILRRNGGQVVTLSWQENRQG